MNALEQPTPANDPFGMSRFSPRRYSVQQFTLLVTANILGIAILTWAVAAREPLLIGLSATMAAVMAAMTVLVFWVGFRTIAVEAWIRRLGMGDLEYRIEPWGKDEVSKACMALEALRQSSIRAMQLDLVTQLSQEVQEKNDELEDTLAELRRAQDRLVSQQKLTELGQLTNAIAHELSNPVNLIANFAGSSRELMAELGESLGQEGEAREVLAELGQNLQGIENSCERASRIVQDALRLGQERESDFEEVEVNPLVQAYVRNTLETTRQRDAKTVTFEVLEDLDQGAGVIQAVPADLGRVVAQITGNALDAMAERAESEDPGSGYRPVLSVGTMRTEEQVEITFRDNGTGIPAEVLPRIFNPFFTTRMGNRRAGLGLSLTHDIVREHGGEITIDSEPGRYTRVTVSIPDHIPGSPGEPETKPLDEIRESRDVDPDGTVPTHMQRARELAERVDRDIELVENDRHRGYSLSKPGSSRIGFVRFNESAGTYIVYACWKFDDPQNRFRNETRGRPNQAWFLRVSPDDQELLGYAVTVLESSFDYK